ncbi:MAG: sulfur carrier protein ThiS [Clostridia bacterium]|nr:sulfur carrier protein ThiS [Clostridia bacterium]
MNITVNGKCEEIQETLKLLDFLEAKGLDPKKVVVEYNNEIIKREDWGSVWLKDNDKLEVLRFVGGG